MGRGLNSPCAIVREGLKVLPKRTKDIVARRFGINERGPETLESIGQNYGITRERVRQIEDDGLSKLKREEVSLLFKPVVSRLESYLRTYGNLRREDTLLRDLTSLYFGKAQNNREAKECPASLTLILTISEPFEYFRETEEFHPSWVLDKESFESAREIVASLIKHLDSMNDTLHEKDIMDWFSQNASHLSTNAHASYLDAAKPVEKNIFDQYGLIHWPVISPRGVRDRAYLVFKKRGEPIHFTKVADLINEMGFSPRKAYAQTVHNELIKDDRFVLVGRGLYALSEWGYKPGTVMNVIADVLREAQRPMTKQEIIDEVLRKRMVKVSTISLNIHNSPELQKTKEGSYILTA